MPDAIEVDLEASRPDPSGGGSRWGWLFIGIGLGFLGVCSVIYAYSSEASRVLVAFALAYVASALGAAIANTTPVAAIKTRSHRMVISCVKTWKMGLLKRKRVIAPTRYQRGVPATA